MMSNDWKAGDLVQYVEHVKEVGQPKPDPNEFGFVIGKYAQCFWEVKWLSGKITAEYIGNLKWIAH